MFNGLPWKRSEPLFAAESEDKILEMDEANALQAGMTDLSAPAAGVDFNGRVLAALHAERDFDSWPRQAAARLFWILPPALIGFLLAYAAACFLTRTPQSAPASAPIAAFSAAPNAARHGE